MRLESSSDCCSWQKTAKRRLRLISSNEMPQAEGDKTTITETTTTTKMKNFVPPVEDIEDDHLLREDRTRSSLEEGEEEEIHSLSKEIELYHDQEYFYCDENSNQINSNSKQRSCHQEFNEENTIKSSEKFHHNYNNNKSSKPTARFTKLHLLAVFIGLIINHLGEHSLQANGSFPSLPPPPSLLSQQANSIGGLQQYMAQMLQTFNGNDSQHLEANHFKLLERDGDFLLVGAR